MHASAYHRTGPAGEIAWREVPDPAPDAGTVVVRPEAVAVVHVDTLVRSGGWRTELRFPQAVGRDAVGTVLESGDARFAAGDRVWTCTGGYDGRPGVTAEAVAVAGDRLFLLPEGADPTRFVGLLHSGATVHGGLERLGGMDGIGTLAVTAANGVVGSHLVQVAARRGIRVIAVIRSDAAVARLRELGAAEVVVADGARAVDAVASIAPDGVDAWVEASGRTELSGVTDLLAPRGGLLLLAGRDPLHLDRAALYLREQRIQGFVMSRMTLDELHRAAAEIVADWSAGVRVATTTPRPLSTASAAHAELDSGGPAHDAEGMTPRIVLAPEA